MPHDGRNGILYRMSPLMDNQGSPNGSPATIHEEPSVSDVEARVKLPTDGGSDAVLHSERDIATHVISIEDDPSLNPWTFRAFLLGLGLSAFGGSLGMFISPVVFSSAYYARQLRFIISNR